MAYRQERVLLGSKLTLKDSYALDSAAELILQMEAHAVQERLNKP